MMQLKALVSGPYKSKLDSKHFGKRPSIHDRAQPASEAIALISNKQGAWTISDDRKDHKSIVMRLIFELKQVVT